MATLHPTKPVEDSFESDSIFFEENNPLARNSSSSVMHHPVGSTTIPEFIGHYRLLRPLGKGGMAKVYLAEHTKTCKKVALKMLDQQTTKKTANRERFLREARAATVLDHENIVHACDFGESNGYLFIAMEFVEGRDLESIRREKGQFSVGAAVNYIVQAAAGLQYAHLCGLVHRDIKPANLILDQKGSIKILDLGLARFPAERKDYVTEEFDEGAVICTPDFVAPEQLVDSRTVDSRADIYSLGATLYTLLTGRAPFDGTVAQKLIFHQCREPEPISTFRRDVPEKLQSVIAMMMCKDRHKRLQTGDSVIRALTPWAKPDEKTHGDTQRVSSEKTVVGPNWSEITDEQVDNKSNETTSHYATQIVNITKPKSKWNRGTLVGIILVVGLSAILVSRSVILKQATSSESDRPAQKSNH